MSNFRKCVICLICALAWISSLPAMAEGPAGALSAVELAPRKLLELQAKLTDAAWAGDLQQVKSLLPEGDPTANAVAPGFDGVTLVDATLQAAMRAGHDKVAAYLLDRGEAEHMDWAQRGASDRLGVAVEKNMPMTFARSLVRATNLESTLGTGLTPLDVAVSRGRYSMADQLIAMGARMDSEDQGDTLLHRRITAGDPEGVAYLLKKGANPNHRDAKGRTAREHALDEVESRKQSIERQLNKIKAARENLRELGRKQLGTEPTDEWLESQYRIGHDSELEEADAEIMQNRLRNAEQILRSIPGGEIVPTGNLFLKNLVPIGVDPRFPNALRKELHYVDEVWGLPIRMTADSAS